MRTIFRVWLRSGATLASSVAQDQAKRGESWYAATRDGKAPRRYGAGTVAFTTPGFGRDLVRVVDENEKLM